MANNITLNSGSGGAVLATDDISNVHYQIIKLAHGGDDSATLISTSSGLPVQQQGTWNIGGITDALPAGTNAIGKLVANSGVDIGDVDVTSVIPGTGATNLGKAIDTATGLTDTGVLLLATRDDALGALTPIEGDCVQLRVDANGALWTHDDALDACIGGSELQVDVITMPSVAVTNAGITTIAGAVSGTEVQVDVLTLPTVVLNAETTKVIGTINIAATQTLATVTTVSTVTAIGTSVTPGTSAAHLGKAEDAVHSSGDTGVYILGVRDDAVAVHSGADGDYESLHINAEGALYTRDTPSTTGGLSIFRSLDLDESEEDVKTSAGQIYVIHAMNTTAALLYLKVYNAAAADVVVGTTAPVLTFPVPGNGDTDGAGFVMNVPQGVAFATAICVACTTGVADNDTGAPGANACVVNILYK